MRWKGLQIAGAKSGASAGVHLCSEVCSGEAALVGEILSAEHTRTFQHIELAPRQRVVASPGKLSEPDLAPSWEDVETLLKGR